MTNQEDDEKAAKAYNYGVVAGLELAKSVVMNLKDSCEPDENGELWACKEITEKLDDLLKAFLEGR